MTKERPILFSGEMVRAILDGRKTQTRRVMKPQPDMVSRHGEPVLFKTIERINPETREVEVLSHVPGEPGKKYCRQINCPYGQIGDRLWVRESFAYLKPNSNDPSSPDKIHTIAYKATDKSPGGIKWKPSIFMPRAASRILLEITGVRVERLQDISEEDAIAEGIEFVQCGEFCQGFWEYQGWKDYIDLGGKDNLFDSSIQSFKSLWDSVNAKKHPWESNPWVWVIEFKRLDNQS